MVTPLFIVTVVVCVVILLAAWRKAFDGRDARLIAGGLTVIWLIVIAELARAEVFTPSVDRPPLMLALPLTAATVLTVLALRGPGARLIARVPQAWIVGFQAFRIPVEIFLWQAAVQGLAPEIMSWHGRNFDVISGVLALGLGLWLSRRPAPRWVLAAFHVIGLALLLNVVIHAILSVPGPFRQFETDPPLVFVTTAPFVWLPGFLVPMAFAGHVLGLRALRNRPLAE